MSLKIGCVPEHFSSPLTIGEIKGHFKRHFVDVDVVFCPGGTGEMIKKVSSGEIDVIVALTEGLVAEIAKGSQDFKIVGTYVDSPLTWAISAGQKSAHESVETLKGKMIGISRFGSGSHIMSYVLADNKGWIDCENQSCFQFNVLTNFEGLRNGVNNEEADAFMWEIFTTKPYHDSKEVKLIGKITTPWPCFMIAVKTSFLEKETELVKRLLVAISESSRDFIKEKESGESIEYVSKNFKQKKEDVEAWFKTVSYPEECSKVSGSVITHCVQTLKKARVIDSQSIEDPSHYIYEKTTTITN